RGRLQGVFIVVVAGGPRVGDVAHGVAAASVGTAVAASGGGVLVVIGVVIAAIAFPAFLRFTVRGAVDRGTAAWPLGRPPRVRGRRPPADGLGRDRSSRGTAGA